MSLGSLPFPWVEALWVTVLKVSWPPWGSAQTTAAQPLCPPAWHTRGRRAKAAPVCTDAHSLGKRRM